MLFCATFSTKNYSIMGQCMGQTVDPCFLGLYFNAKSQKNHRFLGENGGFYVNRLQQRCFASGFEPSQLFSTGFSITQLVMAKNMHECISKHFGFLLLECSIIKDRQEVLI